jgi:hypothetical protein
MSYNGTIIFCGGWGMQCELELKACKAGALPFEPFLQSQDGTRFKEKIVVR